MKALFFDTQLALREVDTLRPAAGEALIRVTLAGICGTDRQILKGYSGFRGIPGHEFVGQVVECEERDWIGKRVVGEINVTCGRCDFCSRGLGRHCRDRSVMGIVNRPGAFAEYVTLPFANLHEVPASVSDEAAVFTEPLAAAAEILEQMPVPTGTRVAVLGAGRLGLLVAQVLNHAGARVMVIGRGAGKLELARSWGLSTVNTVDAAASSLSARSFPMVVDATGAPSGLDEALRLVEPRGTVVMKSTFHGPAHFDTAKLVVDEITLLGSRCGNFATALHLLTTGAVRTRELISKVVSLEAGVEAFNYLNAPSCLKVLLSTGRQTGA
ncbi:MAG TPA: alcohol dehydrogenase catalytic domain-containing protein [Terriglobia bacterium]|nr:alcohol dehydrogenase catalytic domain-containing protein [Terriglobia bacterium]